MANLFKRKKYDLNFDFDLDFLDFSKNSIYSLVDT